MTSCFFTGHRYFSYKKDPDVLDYLGNLLPILVENGVTDFYSGGALGWDKECEFVINIMKKMYYPQIKLNLILPCPPEIQSQNWNEKDKAEFKARIDVADSVEIVSKENDKDCMKKRNARLVETGDICVCYFNRNDFRSGTGQTVRMAEKANKIIFNLNFVNKRKIAPDERPV